MKILITALAILQLSFLPAPVFAQAEDTAAAESVAMRWLDSLDASDIETTWNDAATLFKSSITLEKWTEAVAAVRDPLGEVRTRAKTSLTATRSLPGLPDGQYVVLQFNTEYDNKASAIETVTLTLDAGEEWKVAGYFIR